MQTKYGNIEYFTYILEFLKDKQGVAMVQMCRCTIILFVQEYSIFSNIKILHNCQSKHSKKVIV